MKKSVWMLPLVLAAAACGTSGDFRRISFSSDLSSADLAHYRAEAEASGSSQVTLEDYSTGLPFWPAIWRDREGAAARAGDEGYHYHFEDDFGLALWLINTHATANFDPDGTNSAWDSGQSLLVGAVKNSSGERIVNGARVPTSEFRLLWGLFGTSRTTEGRNWRFLWIPF